MEEKNRGMSHEFLIYPGETIADILEDREMTQKELAQRAGVSEAFLSDVIHGKKNISKGLAMGLEYALGVSRSFWLKLQANYDAEVLGVLEKDSVVDDEFNVLSSIDEVVSYLCANGDIPVGMSHEETILTLRKHLCISDLSNLRNLSATGAFMLSNKADVQPDVMGAWLCLCKLQDWQSNVAVVFDPSRMNELITQLNRIRMTCKTDLQQSLKSLFSEYGIAFSILQSFNGAPVLGYITKKTDGTYKMVLAVHENDSDLFWFSLFHELGHLMNGDVSSMGNFIDAKHPASDSREMAADDFARKVLSIS